MWARWICYGGLLGVALYLQYYYNDPFSLLLVFLLLLVLPLALLYALAGLKYLNAQITALPTAAEKGGRVTLQFRFQNKSLLFFPHVRAACQVMGQPKSQARHFRFGLAGFETRLVECTFDCAYCGTYDSKVLKLSFSDPFGLFRFFRKPGCEVSVLVLPRMIPLPPSPSFMEEESDRPAALETTERGNSSIAGIRDYIPGDPLRNIHWKLTAKWERLMVKEFDFIKKERERVLIDRFMPEAEPANTDCLLETATALALRYLTENRPADFAWLEETGALVDVPLASRDDFNRFFPLCAASKDVANPECRPVNLLELLSNPSFFRGGPLTVLTTTQSASFYEALLALASSHQFPICLVVIGNMEPAVSPLLEQLQGCGVLLVKIPDGEIAAAFSNP